MALFKNKYRIESTRLLGWDYGQAGYYYVTICTKNRVHIFGDVANADVHLSVVGEIVAEEWLKTEIIRKNVQLDAWIIMPNHIHLILRIVYKIDSHVETPRRGVSTDGRDVLTPKQLQTQAASEKWAANTLGSIIGQFKGACTKRIWADGFADFAWQARFYDRIIRTEEALQKARHYIWSNPDNWELDRDKNAGLYM